MPIRVILAVMLLFVWGCGEVGPSDDGSDASVMAAGVRAAKDAPVATDDALERPGELADGSVVMVNGRAISPAGLMRNVRDFPSNLLLMPNGDVVVPGIRGRGFNVIDGNAFTELANVAAEGLFHGVTTNAAGDMLWVSGGGLETIYEYTVTAGVPTLARELPGTLVPAGLALSPDETKLYACNSYGSGLAVMDLASGTITDVAPTGTYPYEVVLSASGTQAYVSNWAGDTVTFINTTTRERVAEVTVGLHPGALALSPDGETLYVANADGDTISVVDVSAREETAQYDLYRADEMIGASPADVAVSADGDTLYVAAAGLNAVVLLDAADGEVLGMIPTGYYPTAVALDESQGVLYVANGKGGRPSGTPGWGVSNTGLLEKIDLPTAPELAEYTQAVMDNLTRTELYWQTMDFESPIPTQRGVPSTQIKRVVYIMKENKTYDQVLGDMPGTEGDPSLVVFGEDYTPNAHNLATQFTNCDNYYSEANVSLQGHMWSVSMFSNDYMEKGWAMSDPRYPLANIEPAAKPKSIFKHLAENGVDFRIYGQVLSLGEVPELTEKIDLKYGFWNLGVSDEIKADEIIREMEAGIWPPLMYISLHNDHTNGSDAGSPTPQYYVGDNDAGLGKLVEYITHSEYWPETAIFITEDDPQSGADHVDPHRSISLVISPWAKHGYTSSVLYSMSSIWMTIEMILGLPPMTVYDEHTSPMYDCFTMTPDTATYTGVPNPTPLAYNPDDGPMADYCASARFDAPDQVRRLGEVVWSVMRPGEPWPAHLSVDSYADEDEDDEDDANDYRAAVRAIEDHARQAELWHGERLPTIDELVAQGVLRVEATQ